MKNRRNYYRILHVQPDAPPAVVRTSYKTIMQKLRAHPDLGGDGEQARLINQAYAVLSDSQKRRVYDRQFRPWNRSSHQGNNASSHTASASKADVKPPRSSRGQRHHRCSFCGTINRVEPRLSGTYRCGRCRESFSKGNASQQQNCKRQAKRLPQQGSLQFSTQQGKQIFRGELLDLSPQGMRFESGISIKRGETIRIECKTIHAVARVTHCTKSMTHPDKFKVGAKFRKIHSSFRVGTFVSDVI